MNEDDKKIVENAVLTPDQQLKVLVLIYDYASHDSWRCEHYQECRCGLNKTLRELGLPPVPIHPSTTRGIN